MIFGSICSGIEGASVAWLPLGWRCAWMAEIDPFCCAVLKYHYPEVPNYGDFTQIGVTVKAEPVDLIVGGTPCQDFSVAGLRAGLAGSRGQLTLEFIRLIDRMRPRWVVWENVPGVLSIDRGRAFGTFLGALGKCGYGFAYRILDARYLGVPQRRRRVFVVGYLGNWRPPAAVLFERASLSGGSASRRTTQEGAPNIPVHRTAGSGCHTIARCLTVGEGRRQDYETCTFVPVNNQTMYQVRRLTPRECERLQGFPDDYTLVPYRGKLASDGPRYKALGNAFAVPVIRWLGQRIETVENSLSLRRGIDGLETVRGGGST
jgi:DNA (cytosine-5)-methyltransferase 1